MFWIRHINTLGTMDLTDNGTTTLFTKSHPYLNESATKSSRARFSLSTHSNHIHECRFACNWEIELVRMLQCDHIRILQSHLNTEGQPKLTPFLSFDVSKKNRRKKICWWNFFSADDKESFSNEFFLALRDSPSFQNSDLNQSRILLITAIIMMGSACGCCG